MNIKKIAEKTGSFVVDRLFEIFGLLLILISIAMFISFLSYSPDDPNFIIKEPQEIKNLLGFRGSYFSDIVLQSVGLIAYLYPFTFFFTGIKIVNSKQIVIIIENFFYLVIYTLIGTLFFSIHYEESFSLINGNGGFTGFYLKEFPIFNFFESENKIIFALHIFLILFFFCISINFTLNVFRIIYKKVKRIKNKEKEEIYINNEILINENLQVNNKDTNIRQQEDLPFGSIDKDINVRLKFKLPKIEILENRIKDNINKRLSLNRNEK